MLLPKSSCLAFLYYCSNSILYAANTPITWISQFQHILPRFTQPENALHPSSSTLQKFPGQIPFLQLITTCKQDKATLATALLHRVSLENVNAGLLIEMLKGTWVIDETSCDDNLTAFSNNHPSPGFKIAA